MEHPNFREPTGIWCACPGVCGRAPFECQASGWFNESAFLHWLDASMPRLAPTLSERQMRVMILHKQRLGRGGDALAVGLLMHAMLAARPSWGTRRDYGMF